MKNKYQIYIISKGKQYEYKGSYTTEEKANKAFYQILEENKKIIFPVMYINTTKIEEAKYELIILKRKEENDNNITKLRNNYGEFVNHVINSENWVLYDKAPFYKEETFWVYGYHPLFQRKTFSFIFDELVKPKAMKKETMVTFYIFRNKLLIDTTYHLDLVICKNKSDCIRLYNMLEEFCNKTKKVRYYLFNGDWSSERKKVKICVEKIRNLTNWNDVKIKRYNTRP